MFFQIIEVGKEEIGLVWSDEAGKIKIEAIYLPGPEKMAGRILHDFPAVDKKSREAPGDIGQLVADLYRGEKRSFNLSLLDWSRLTKFSAGVLKKTAQIPRGKVFTYSGLAREAGSPRAARAVGTALANNPFPIVVPCHRVIRADATVGQFGGGSEMKKQLLEKEGVRFDARGIISPVCIRS